MTVEHKLTFRFLTQELAKKSVTFKKTLNYKPTNQDSGRHSMLFKMQISPDSVASWG
jgi:hypothetical protein